MKQCEFMQYIAGVYQMQGKQAASKCPTEPKRGDRKENAGKGKGLCDQTGANVPWRTTSRLPQNSWLRYGRIAFGDC